MDNILLYLQTMLSVLITPSFGFKDVSIETELQIMEGLKIGKLPALFIIPLGEEFSQTGNGNSIVGFIANEAQIEYRLKLRYFWGSVVKDAPMTQQKMNIYQLSNQIRNLLIKDKTLGGLVTNGLDVNMKAVDLSVISEFQGQYLGRDMFLTYASRVRWDSNLNNQPTLTPDGM